MRKWRNDFKNKSTHNPGYDIFDDFNLIESSFTQQYGIRLRKEMGNMSWGEFISLLGGINGDTALGNIVRIRKENDPKRLKEFTAEEREIRREWLNKNAYKVSKEDYDQAMENFKNMFKNMAKK